MKDRRTFATLAQEAEDYVNHADAEVRRRLLKRAKSYGIKTSEDEMGDLLKAWKRARQEGQEDSEEEVIDAEAAAAPGGGKQWLKIHS